MKRATLLLTVLGLILVLVGWYLLMWQPRAEDLARVEEETVSVRAAQETTRARIATLEGVRERAPELQAELVAIESLLPRDPAIASALRQLQLAADDSGVTLLSINPTRPNVIEADGGLHEMRVSLEMQGRYFALLDAMRRLEDPEITSRGIVWEGLTITRDESTYPELTAALTGRIFTVLPQPMVAPDPADQTTGGTSANDGGTTDADDSGITAITAEETVQ